VGLALSVVTIQGLGAWIRPESLAGALFDLDHFAALVIAALRASAMRELALVTVGTLRQGLCLQMIMRSPL